ncbi:MAG: hypothetical protein ACR5K7_04070 [Symbiopectobacterium sp.]
MLQSDYYRLFCDYLTPDDGMAI